MKEKSRPDVLTLSTKFYDVSVSQDLSSKADREPRGQGGSLARPYSGPHSRPYIAFIVQGRVSIRS